MKTLWNKKKAAAALALSSLALLSGCGKSPSATTPGGVSAPLTGGVGVSQCIPLTGQAQVQIPFTAAGMYFGVSDYAVIAGHIPVDAAEQTRGQTYGSVMLGGAYGAPVAAGGMQYIRELKNPDFSIGGTMSLNITSGAITTPMQPGYGAGYGTGYGAGNASASGVIQLGPYLQQLLMNEVQLNPGKYGYQQAPMPYPGGYQNTYPNSYPNPYTGIPGAAPGMIAPGSVAPCVSGIAFDLDRTVGNQSRVLYNGKIYFYLNNTQHGLGL